MEPGMIILLLVLVGIMTYILFSPTSIIGPWLDRHCKKERNAWCGEDVEPNYQEGTPFTPALDVPYEDPEVPHRPSKKSKKKKKTNSNRNVGPVNGRKTKRVYKKRVKNE